MSNRLKRLVRRGFGLSSLSVELSNPKKLLACVFKRRNSPCRSRRQPVQYAAVGIIRPSSCTQR